MNPASAATKDEYQVVSRVGDSDIAVGDTIWTKDVIVESHPAGKDELEVDLVVLFTTRPAEEGLENARWNRGRISSLDSLY